MHLFVLTGAPGAGKTALLRQLEADYVVVEEAATDVIALEQAAGCAEPWLSPGFIATITALQQARQERCLAAQGPAAQGLAATAVADRSPVCTLALARFLGYPVPPILAAELDRIAAGRVYRPEVFFVRSLGFVTPSAARRISLADAHAFGRVHEETYRELGFRLIDVPAGPLGERARLVRQAIEQAASYAGPGGFTPGAANQVSGSSWTGGAPADATAPATSVRR